MKLLGGEVNGYHIIHTQDWMEGNGLIVTTQRLYYPWWGWLFGRKPKKRVERFFTYEGNEWWTHDEDKSCNAGTTNTLRLLYLGLKNA